MLTSPLSANRVCGCCMATPAYQIQSAAMHTDLWALSATELVEAFRKKTLSPVDVTRAVLARIEQLNPKLNAFCLVSETALEDAKASEARWTAGQPRGLLDGVPVSIKDIILTKGWPTLRGSKTIDPEGTVERRRAGDGAAARARRGAARQDHHAGVRLEGRDRQPAHRHHAQSVEPGEDAGRLVRRRGGGGGRRHGTARGRHRRRRLDPHPVLASPACSASSRRSAACRPGRCRPSAPWRTSAR